MLISDTPQTESHAQRVMRLREEFRCRFERYRNDPTLWPSLEKLMLLKADADNNLTPDELDKLDRSLERLRKIRARFNAPSRR